MTCLRSTCVAFALGALAACEPGEAPTITDAASNPTVIAEPDDEAFRIRGMLPWHNFLSGPTSWNRDDYARYLDECASRGINLIAFHNYTGGAERYVTYVEPMIRISWLDIVPEAYLDNSMTARWGYRPLRASQMPFGAAEQMPVADGADAFGADVSVTSQTTNEHYRRTRSLMQDVLEMAHDRGIAMAMGFEFGVHPPEYLSVRMTSAPSAGWYGTASFMPNPTSPQARELLYRTVDDILDTYPSIDWIWLWLNEHTMFGVDVEHALDDQRFARIFAQHAPHFEGASLEMRFLGVWALEYIRLAEAHIRSRAPEVGIAISGWGGSNQLTPILRGLDDALPDEIVFTSLNPSQGEEPHAPVLAEIARNRRVWAIPWLEGDRSLWHPQPRVFDLADQLGRARRDSLDGVLAIHWRTEEIRFNFRAFTRLAGSIDEADDAESLLLRLLEEEFGATAAAILGPPLVAMDRDHWMRPLVSEEYYSYEPHWGRLEPDLERRLRDLIGLADQAIPLASEDPHRANIGWLRKDLEVTLLLHEVGLKMERSYRAYNAVMAGDMSESEFRGLRPSLAAELAEAPVRQLLTTMADKARSRGEWGVFSAMNQKLWQQYRDLVSFVGDPRASTPP